MTELTPAASETLRPEGSPWVVVLVLLVIAAGLGIIFHEALALMVTYWERPVYSHGFMIPLVAILLLWQRLPELADVAIEPAWLGVLFFVGAILGWALGDFSALTIIVQYSFLLAVWSLALVLFGWRGVLVVWAALVYLIFMIPLPQFFYNNLSSQLQLLSSQIGVWVVRLFNISVYLEGNVIDLGSYQLQVADACSGLRYLFPLMSFGFLIAYLYRGPFWHRAVIFLSTMPITVLMNSFRIGVIGITVNYWGQEMAQGFLHEFEGWFVFMACIGVLLLEIWLLSAVSREKFGLWERINLNFPTWGEIKSATGGRVLGRLSGPLIASLVVVLIAVPVSFVVKDRKEIHPQRVQLDKFPLFYHGWIGSEEGLTPRLLKALKLTDYIIADYRRGSNGVPVNFYVAYYQSQRRGAAIHSPSSCIPGGGWQITHHSIRNLSFIPGAARLKVNRVVIRKGRVRELVYYWFQQRGRIITNVYLAKWYLFWDSLTERRTDGALVRLVTPVPEYGSVKAADKRLEQFVKDFYPLLPNYIPGGLGSSPADSADK